MRFIPAEDLEIVDCKRQNENVTGQLRKCGPRKASLSVRRFEETRLFDGSATIPPPTKAATMAMLDFGGAVLDYDREYCLIHCVFCFIH